MKKNTTKINSSKILIPQKSSTNTKEKIPKYIQSGHFFDQKLTIPSSSQQTNIWEHLLVETKNKIELEEIKVTGIKLKTKQEQVMNGILSLLFQKSDTRKNNKNLPKHPESYFKGNELSSSVNYGEKLVTAPTIRFKLPELYEAISGNKRPSGKEIINIMTALRSLEDQKFLIAYNRKYKIKNELLTDRIEEYLPLIKITKFYDGLSQDELDRVEQDDTDFKNKRAEMILQLNPVFIDQIDTKFIEVPIDINKLTTLANGGRRTHQGIINLRDYILRAIASKNKIKSNNILIDKERLILTLGYEDYLKKGRKKLLEQRINESIQVSIKLNLILKYKEQIGVKGQKQYEFTINLDY